MKHLAGLKTPGSSQPQSNLAPSAYPIHRWENGQGLVTLLARVDHAAGPFPFTLLARNATANGLRH